MHTFGTIFRISIWGASHAPSLGIRIDGVPAGIALSAADFEPDIARRRSGAAGTTPRREADIPVLSGGIADGVTTGGTLEIAFANSNTRSTDYDEFRTHPRPSHADFTARAKYGDGMDLRGGGMFSGRMTLPIVAAGVVAKKILGDVRFASSLVEVGGERNPDEFARVVAEAVAAHDSVGGVVECRAAGAGIGLGEPFFDSAESVISHLMFSVPAVKGIEFGSGFGGVRLRGSKRNDRIADAEGHTFTNNEGGIVGGITNGNEIVVRVALKPTPSIAAPQQTFDFAEGRVAPLCIRGRHDACIALRASVVVEAAVAIALADLKLRNAAHVHP